MRMVPLIAADLKRLFKYRIIHLYVLITAVYMLLFSILPMSVRDTVRNVMLFTDPAAMGLFFMGALVMLEKSERTLDSLAVSPVRAWEYALSKCIALACVGTAAGGILIAAGGTASVNGINSNIGMRAVDFALQLSGLFFGSVLFSLLGMAAAYLAIDLNQFILFVVPLELFFCLPGALLIMGFGLPELFILIHPGAAAANMLTGGIGSAYGIISLLAFCFAACHIVCRILRREWEGWKGAVDKTREGMWKIRQDGNGSKPSRTPVIPYKTAPAVRTAYPKGRPMRCVWLLFLRQIKEDAMLFGALAVPAFCAAGLRFGIPYLERILCGYFEKPTVLSPYYLIFDLMIAAIAPLMCAYVAAMIMLGELDGGTASYFMVTPVGKWGYLLSRILYPGIISGIYSCLLLTAFHMARESGGNILFMCAAGIVFGIHTLLFVVTFAGNQVEGMGLVKLSSILLAGLPAAFLVKGGWRFLFYPLPSFWAAEFAAKKNAWAAAGFLLTAAGLAFGLWKRFEKKRIR